MFRRFFYEKKGHILSGKADVRQGDMERKWRHLAICLEVFCLVILCMQLGIKKADGKKTDEKKTDETKTEGEKNAEEHLPPRIALTFDDGPNSRYTPLILKGLKERDIQASFFLMGQNLRGNEDLVRQMQRDGHLIGNHTYHHVELDKITEEEAIREIRDTNEEIYEITGIYPSYVRPPYGAWKKNLDFAVRMYPVLWDIDTLDWKSQNVEFVLQIILSQVKDGAVILMHDSYQSSVDAALCIVDILKCQGYEFVTVDELIVL